jgi:hypothetical protein
MRTEKRMIHIRPGFGANTHRTEIEAVCYGDWATHQHLDVPDLWVLTLLPLGLNLPPDWCSFPTETQATEAMVEIAMLRNSWSVVTQADFTRDLKVRLMAIAARHGAVEGPLGAAAQADTSRLGKKLDVRPNGYGPAL